VFGGAPVTHEVCQPADIEFLAEQWSASTAPIRADVADVAGEAAGAEGGDALPDFPEQAWRGVFADYRGAMQGTTEASDVAHFASLWAAIAATLARSVCMYAGDPVYANVYLAIFGGTGDKKTTAMRRPLGLGLIPQHVKVVRNVGSAEGLADALKREDDADAVALFFWEELTSLLARGRWAGSTVLEFLTEAFDCPPTWGLAYRRDKVEIGNPTPTIITGTTTEWFWKNARAEDFYGGFGNRFLFLTGKRKPPIPNPAEPDQNALQRVRDVFTRISKTTLVNAKLNADAESVWEKYYIQSENHASAGLHGAATKRIHVYIRKLAMAYAAAEETLPAVTEDQLRAAIAVGQYASKSVQCLLDVQATTGSRNAELEQKFLNWLQRNGGFAKKRYMQQTLSKSCGCCETFNRVLRSLAQAGHIEIRANDVFLLG
jgi:hypothetical protein